MLILTQDCFLNEMITEEGSWNLDLFRVWLLDDVIQRIMGIPPGHIHLRGLIKSHGVTLR